jgi:hypothetical protein
MVDHIGKSARVSLQYTVHVVTIYGIDAIANEIAVVLNFFLLGNENTSFNFPKTKQNSYYLNLFHESIYFRICVGLPRNCPSVCGDLPMWSTIMRTTVL